VRFVRKLKASARSADRLRVIPVVLLWGVVLKMQSCTGNRFERRVRDGGGLLIGKKWKCLGYGDPEL
jgi:hypothetical protein